jgi:hypothetical protein
MSERNQKFIAARQVRQRYGNVSHMWIERRLETDPTFPKPIYIAKRRFWDLEALERWERDKATKSNRGGDFAETSEVSFR